MGRPRLYPEGTRRPSGPSGRSLPLSDDETSAQVDLLATAATAVDRFDASTGPKPGAWPAVALAANLGDIYGRALLSRAWRGAYRLPAGKIEALQALVGKIEKSSIPSLTA